MRREAEQAEFERQEVIRKKREFEEALKVEQEKKRLEKIKQGANKKRRRFGEPSDEESKVDEERK